MINDDHNMNMLAHKVFEAIARNNRPRSLWLVGATMQDCPAKGERERRLKNGGAVLVGVYDHDAEFGHIFEDIKYITEGNGNV